MKVNTQRPFAWVMLVGAAFCVATISEAQTVTERQNEAAQRAASAAVRALRDAVRYSSPPTSVHSMIYQCDADMDRTTGRISRSAADKARGFYPWRPGCTFVRTESDWNGDEKARLALVCEPSAAGGRTLTYLILGTPLSAGGLGTALTVSKPLSLEVRIEGVTPYREVFTGEALESKLHSHTTVDLEMVSQLETVVFVGEGTSSSPTEPFLTALASSRVITASVDFGDGPITARFGGTNATRAIRTSWCR